MSLHYLASKRRFAKTVSHAAHTATRMTWTEDKPDYSFSYILNFIRYYELQGLAKHRFAAQVRQIVKWGEFPTTEDND